MRPTSSTIIIIVSMVALCTGAELSTKHSPTDLSPLSLQHEKEPTMTFDQFKLKYNKQYPSKAEETFRMMIFQQNMQECEKHNSNPARKYNMKANFFMDMTSDEFQHVYTTTYPSDQQS